jgi:hypothetical protein
MSVALRGCLDSHAVVKRKMSKSMQTDCQFVDDCSDVHSVTGPVASNGAVREGHGD